MLGARLTASWDSTLAATSNRAWWVEPPGWPTCQPCTLAVPLPFHRSPQPADDVAFAVQASGRHGDPSMSHQGGVGPVATSTSITSSTVNTPSAGLASRTVGYRENVMTLLPQPNDAIPGRPAPPGGLQSFHPSEIPCPAAVDGVAAP